MHYTTGRLTLCTEIVGVHSEIHTKKELNALYGGNAEFLNTKFGDNICTTVTRLMPRRRQKNAEFLNTKFGDNICTTVTILMPRRRQKILSRFTVHSFIRCKLVVTSNKTYILKFSFHATQKTEY